MPSKRHDVWYLEQLRISRRWAGGECERELDPPDVGVVVGVATPLPQLRAEVGRDPGQSCEEFLNSAQGEGAAVTGISEHVFVNV